MSNREWPGEVPAPAFEGLGARPADQPPAAEQEQGNSAGDKPRILIVGGSMGGCCAALALGELGCPVSVYERAPGDLKTQGAGLVVQPDMADFLLRYGVVQEVEEVCVRSAGRQYIDGGGNIVGGEDRPQLFTAWDVLHRAIKARVPKQAYHGSSTVASVESAPDGVSLTLESGERHSGALLVGCDGPGSVVRRTFLQDVKSEYQGYVAWRGFAYEHEVPRHVVEFLANKFTVQQMPRSHILAYTIPSADGSSQPGQRRINWVWYVNTPEQDLQHLFKDVHGKVHPFSVPRGLLRPEVAAERKRVAQQELAPPMADLVGSTADVFAQAIHDMLVPRMALTPNVCLLGDSACILRPHTAAGTTKAAVNSMTLAASLHRHGWRVEPALRDYEASQLELARYLVDVGRRVGTASQSPDESTLREREAAARGERTAGSMSPWGTTGSLEKRQ